VKGEFYQNRDGKVVLCLGFRSWAAVGIKCVKHSVDGKDARLRDVDLFIIGW
jgi:hypothetical protein